MTPELERVLRHELTHAFVQQATHGRCPQWLNEGIAQLMEGRSASSYGPQLAALWAKQKQLPLNELDGSFRSLAEREVNVAYAESLVTVEYLRNTYGLSDITRILQRIGEGQPAEAALRATVHSGYAELQEEVGRYLTSTYGR